MNEYGFDYMNYITNVPNNMNYNPNQQMNLNPQIAEQQNFNIMSNMIPNQQTIDPTKGWLRGNLFKNLYEPYKNFKPMEINPKNEQEALLYQIMQYKFALIELNLYLDTNPNDFEKIKLYQQYLEIEKQMTNKYESMYGPLTLGSNYIEKNNWTWKNSPWPWEGV